jgi:DNA polymerase-3 subunit gamma/tau
MNVVEMDAASHRGIDDVRGIVEEIQYSPSEGRYKVYIIDEAHMMTTEAFNALLKTLEEPPSYVIFILATTDPQRIPITILSRCQRYDFHRMTIDTIAGQLRYLTKEEGIEAEEKALYYIAKAADGSMRDGLSLLDQCIAFYLGKELTYDRVLEVLGAVDMEVFSEMFHYIVEEKSVDALELLERLVIEGRELHTFTQDFTWYLRNLLLLKASDMAADMIDASDEQRKALKQDSLLAEEATLMRYIRVLSELLNQLKYATQKRILTEITLIKLCKPQMETNYDSLVDRVRQLEKQLKEGVFLSVTDRDSQGASKEKVPSESVDEKTAGELSPEKLRALAKALPEDLQAVGRDWDGIVANLSPALRSMLHSAIPVAGDGNLLILHFTDELEKNFVDSPTHLEEIEATIQNRIQKEIRVEARFSEREGQKAQEEPDLRKIMGSLEKKGIVVEYED